MEIKKLYTSIGFGLYLKSLTTAEFCKLSDAEIPTIKEGANGYFRIDSIKLRIRNDYDKFLFNPLVQQMFVNPYEKPNIDNYQSEIPGTSIIDYDFHLKEWEDAEKDIIFNNPQHKWNHYLEDKYFTLFINGVLTPQLKNQTLYQLSQAIGGEVKLQYVNL